MTTASANAAANATMTPNERSLRSVFVGNIPYDATEERLKDIFSEVGPVLSFRLVYDRESGKPKGYGFCEYKDQETALSAMRNLNSYELNGRTLRVDNAANERTKEELRNLQSSLTGSFESPYGPEVEPEKAPETISKVMASLPPEQMWDLLKQMRHCIQTNPNEARNMLIQNPQLSYALLQALVVMKVYDVPTVSNLLYKQQPAPPIFTVPEGNVPVHVQQSTWNQQTMPDPYRAGPVQASNNLRIDSMALDPRARDSHLHPDPRASRNTAYDPRLSQAPVTPAPVVNAVRPPVPTSGRGATAPVPAVPPSIGQAFAANILTGLPSLGNSEQEKAALILQVLQLSDAQIAQLPPEQRDSIKMLKDQLNLTRT